MLDAASIIGGLLLLVVGGELIVRGASRLALRLRLSPVVIGLTVVAFGTSSPELAVSVGATLGGSPDVAVGNVVGSNIYNILLILGLAALLRRLVVRQQLVHFDVPLVIAASVLLWVLVLDGTLSTAEGAVLVGLLVGYIAISLRIGRRTSDPAAAEATRLTPPEPPAGSRRRDALVMLAGLVALVAGSQLLVGGATSLARTLGVPELVIGLTVVAIGTSLPELVTTVVATLRGQQDIAVGNVMGSNLFNILAILGLTALIAPNGIPVAEQVRAFDLPVMTAVAVACLPLLFTGYELRRWEGGLFVTYAALYTGYVLLDATRHPLLEPLTAAMLWFVLPLTAITLATVVLREFDLFGRWRRARGSGGTEAG